MAIEKQLEELDLEQANALAEEQTASETVENIDGVVETFDMEEYVYEELPHDENLVPYMEKEDLDELGTKVVDDCDQDRQSRSEWYNTVAQGMDLLGLKLKKSGGAFEGACTATHPLIMEAATKFQSKASAELFPSKGPCHSQILGKVTPEKEEQAQRTKTFMNYQLTEEMEEYFPDTERMLLLLPLIGSAFKKTYWDVSLNRPVSELIPVENFDVPYNATDLKRAPRYTHTIPLTKDEYERRAEDGMYDPTIDLGEPSRYTPGVVEDKLAETTGVNQTNTDSDEVYTLLEQHVNLVIPVDAGHPEEMEGTPLPYIITVDKDSEKVVALRKNWEEDDFNYEKQVWFTHYQFVPGLGFYGLGYIHLLGNLQATLTAALRSLIDAGQFANMQGGFKSKNMRMADSTEITPGKFVDVEVLNGKIQDAVMPLPFKEPSNVLFQMLDYLASAGQKFADSTEQVVSESSNYGPVGTTMALLEESTKFFTAIHKRLHFAQKKELKTIAHLFSLYLPDEGFVIDVVNGEVLVYKEDFDGRIDVIPVSDPNVASQAQRVIKIETVLETAMRNPEIHDMRELHKRLYLTMGVDDIDKILPPPPEAEPLDPMGDILASVNGKPIRAFQGQNHDAHIQVKQMWLQDPANGSNEMMIKTMPLIEANIREHMIIKYQEQMMGLTQDKMQATGGAQDPNTIAMVQMEAAKEIAFNNEQQMLAGAQETPEVKMANAEELKSKTDALKAERDHEINLRETTVKEFEAEIKAESIGSELELKGATLKAKIKNDEEKLATDLAKTHRSLKTQEKISTINAKNATKKSD